MIKNFLVVLLFLLLFAGCTKEKPDIQQNKTVEDNTQNSSESPEAMKSRFLSYEQRQGKHLYIKYCAVCHGEQGKGDGFNAFNLEIKPRDFTDVKYMNALGDARLLETVSQGGKGVNKSVLMPSWGGRISKSEQEYIIAYIRHFAQSSQ